MKQSGTLAAGQAPGRGFSRELGLLDSTMIVAGSMIGSGIFIVPAEIARQVGSSGWLLLVWVVTGLLTVTAALSYGELAAMMPKAGGQYVYLREAFSPLWGFLFGWTMFLVIQTGTIAAVAVGFARFLGVLAPSISATAWIVPPIDISENYAISLSNQQLVGVVLILFLTAINTRGLKLGKFIQNTFTSAKTLSLFALIVVGILLGRNHAAIAANFTDMWTPHNVSPIHPDFGFIGTVSATTGAFGLLVAFCVSQTGSLFSSDAWNNITFTAAEVKNPRKTIPFSLAVGTGLVITLYILANVAYLVTLPLHAIQTAADDRVATATLEVIFGGAGATIMALAIIVSTFGCNNGLIIAGARVSYAMARDGLFFRSTGELNTKRVPAIGLILQGIWAAFLVLPRTRIHDAAGKVTYGNLYNDLLAYVIFAALMFYALTIAGIFTLRKKHPEWARPYKAFGYPIVPALYILLATTIVVILFLYQTKTVLPGAIIVLSGIPVYWLWRKFGTPLPPSPEEPAG
jgi:APA family basic amino acid/polyamine antiporter